MERWLLARSPLLLKLFDHVLGREVEVDFGGQERVMAQQALQRRQGDPFLDCRDGKGVPEDMRRDRAADAGTVSNALQHALDGVTPICFVSIEVLTRNDLPFTSSQRTE